MKETIEKLRKEQEELLNTNVDTMKNLREKSIQLQNVIRQQELIKQEIVGQILAYNRLLEGLVKNKK